MPHHLSRAEMLAIARAVFANDIEISVEQELQELIENAINHNVYVFVAGFVCHDLFGHSHPEDLIGEEAELLIKRADPIVQFAKLKGNHNDSR